MTLEVVAVAGPAWVQAPARVGWRAHGVPPGGPMVPELAARSERAVGNLPGAAFLEIFGTLTLRARGGPVLLATDGEARVLSDGEAWAIPAPTPLGVRSLSVRGGLVAPMRAGGRGTLPTAAWGGGPLAVGDLLAVRDAGDLPAPRVPAGTLADALLAAPVPLLPPPVPLPLAGAAALSALLSVRWRVAAVSRVGLPLAGPPLPACSGGGEGSDVAWPGLVQLPHGGAPIVLGPDAPTTGGYPVIAVVPAWALGRLFVRPPGAPVRFVRAVAGDALE